MDEWVAMIAAAERFGIPVRRLMAATDGRRLHWKPTRACPHGWAGPDHRMVNLHEVSGYLAGRITERIEDEDEEPTEEQS